MQLYAIFKQYEPKQPDGFIRAAHTVIDCFKPDVRRIGTVRASSADNAIAMAKQLWSGALLSAPTDQRQADKFLAEPLRNL